MPAWIYLTIGVMVAIILFLFFTNKEQTEQILKLEDKIKNNEIKESVSLEKLSIDDSYLLRNEIVSLTSQLSVSEKKVELLQKMCAQVAIQLEESNKEKNALSNEIETLRSIGYSKKPYALSLQRVSQMELETVNSENEALKEENASLLKRLEELKSEATPQVAEDNTPTRYCGTPFIKEIHTLEEKITLLNSEIDSKNKQISNLSEEIRRLSQANQSDRAEGMSAIPQGISFARDGLPVYWKPNPKKPYGDYTVYLNKKSMIYHVDYLCASYMSKETHIFKVIDRARPCKKCAEGFFDFRTVPDWYIPN